MANYNFIKDLTVAKKTEKEVAAILEKKYNAKILEFGKDHRYDILALIDGKEVSFEVKEDFMCQHTNNIAVEFECRGKKSGINTTEADYYIYVVPKAGDVTAYIMYKTSEIIRKIEDKKYFRIVNGGDPGSNTKNYLFKYSVFLIDSITLKNEEN